MELEKWFRHVAGEEVVTFRHLGMFVLEMQALQRSPSCSGRSLAEDVLCYNCFCFAHNRPAAAEVTLSAGQPDFEPAGHCRADSAACPVECDPSS